MSSTVPNPPSPHTQPQPAAQTRCWFTLLHFRCMTCAHRIQVNESPLIGRRQNVHRTVWDFTPGDRRSPGVLIPRRYSLQSFVRSLTDLSNSARCFRSCQRNKSSAYASMCITICSRHPATQLCWTLVLFVSRVITLTTGFLLVDGFSAFSTNGGSEGARGRVPIPDRLRWARGDDSDHDFATPRFNGYCDEAREGSLGFTAPGTGRRPDKPTSATPGLGVSGEF